MLSGGHQLARQYRRCVRSRNASHDGTGLGGKHIADTVGNQLEQGFGVGSGLPGFAIRLCQTDIHATTQGAADFGFADAGGFGQAPDGVVVMAWIGRWQLSAALPAPPIHRDDQFGL